MYIEVSHGRVFFVTRVFHVCVLRCVVRPQASHGALGVASGKADPLGVHVEAFVEGKEDSRDEAEEVSDEWGRRWLW